jgi:hypothetical protein
MQNKINRIFLKLLAGALFLQLPWFLLLIIVSRLDSNEGGGLIGFAIAFAYIELFSVLVLAALPFAWLSTWLFIPLVYPDSDEGITPTDKRIFAAYTWILVAGTVAGGATYILHNSPKLLSMLVWLQDQGALYYMAMAGFVIGLLGPCIYFGTRLLPLLKKRYNISSATVLYGLFCLVGGIVIMVMFFVKDSQTVSHPKFTVYTPNAVEPRSYTVLYRGLDSIWPARVEVLLSSNASVRLSESATNALDAYNPKTKSCIPPPFSNSTFADTGHCKYALTSKGGIKIYYGDAVESYFVIKGTYLEYEGYADGNFVDNLVPGELNGETISPASKNKALELSLYLPQNINISDVRKEYGASRFYVPFSYSNYGGNITVSETYTSQSIPDCTKSNYDTDSICRKAFVTPANRVVYATPTLNYSFVIGHTNVEIFNLQSKIVSNSKEIIEGASNQDVTKFIDSLQLKDN